MGEGKIVAASQMQLRLFSMYLLKEGRFSGVPRLFRFNKGLIDCIRISILIFYCFPSP